MGIIIVLSFIYYNIDRMLYKLYTGVKNIMTIYYTRKKKIFDVKEVKLVHTSKVKAKVVYKRSDIIYFIIEFEEELLTYLKGKIGWGRGYIALPKTHPWYNKTYDNIDVPVHGGITYAAPSDNQYFDIGCNRWIIGFDTMHYSLTPSKFDKDYVLKETRYLLDCAIKAMEKTHNEM